MFYLSISEEIISDLKEKYKDREINIEGDDIKLKVDETLFFYGIK